MRAQTMTITCVHWDIWEHKHWQLPVYSGTYESTNIDYYFVQWDIWEHSHWLLPVYTGTYETDGYSTGNTYEYTNEHQTDQ
mgnify:CR=1 FL=1